MHTICEVPAVKRSTYIGLLVLAFAITAVGVGIIYLAFLPASATQAAVETVSYPIEVLTDIVKPDSVTVDFDGTPAALGVSNYPRIELGARRYTKDEQLIGKATSLLKGKTFKRWYGAAIYRAKNGQMVGGYYSTLELDAANGSKLCNVSYDPGCVDNEGPGGLYLGWRRNLRHGGRPDGSRRFYESVYRGCLRTNLRARSADSAQQWLGTHLAI